MDNNKLLINQLYGSLPLHIEGVEELVEIALDMRWSWNHAADHLWQQLDADIWESTHNPWIILQTISTERLKKSLADQEFRRLITLLQETKRTADTRPAWFQQDYPESELTQIAYFSMEFMLSEALPIYVGGLGNVAGDQLKSASDLGVPVTGIGLLYQQGYFRQEIDENGMQQALFPYNDPGQLPITPLRLPNGEWLRLKLDLAVQPVWLRTWQVQVGRLKLFLLDSNDPANSPANRNITNELYGGGSDQRIQQEILLGIGGWKLLRTLDIKPDVCHMNEGHAAFLVFARASDFMKANGCSFWEALTITRTGNLFTSHTAVAAGFDYFSAALMEQFFGAYAVEELGITFDQLMGMGRIYPDNHSESFNMAYLAIRGSGAVNAVSKLHGTVSRQLFGCLFPRWPITEIPVGSVTNGVHMPSWDSSLADELWTEACGKDRWKGNLNQLSTDIAKVPDDVIWKFRNDSRKQLTDFIKKALTSQSGAQAITAGAESIKKEFNPDILTIGFARRFVPYKRTDLLLHDENRLIRILTNHESPVQLVVAGKAPPYDEEGKMLIRKWILFIEHHALQNHIVFLPDYDMRQAAQMVQGVDVWLNTPRRPWEACGTSGMKVLVNGGLNLSELDGWWAEAYEDDLGWALGDKQEHGFDPAWNAQEAEAMYNLLEKQVIPEFYDRGDDGISERWVERIRQSMSRLTPMFSANRSVREYTEKYYLPAAQNYIRRAAENGADGRKKSQICQDIIKKWPGVRFGFCRVEDRPEGFIFLTSLFLNGIGRENLVVMLYAEPVNEFQMENVVMSLDNCDETTSEYVFRAVLVTKRTSADYTARVFLNILGISVPLENNLILWQQRP